MSCDRHFSHLNYYHLRLLLALQGCKLNLPFYLWQSLKKISQEVRSFSNPDRSLFHHGLIKIILQFQLFVNGKSWDSFLTDCQLGPTQYWPNLSPRIRKKLKAIKSEVDITSETVSEVKGFREVSIPINDGVSNDNDRNTVPCDSKAVLDQPLSGKNDSTPAEIEERLTKSKTDNDFKCENLFETNKPDEYSRESMRRLDHLAQICCDKEGLGFENLSFSRRVTRSMYSTHTILGSIVNQQAPQPAVVNIEDDIPSSIPNTINVNNPTFIQVNDVESGKAEVTQPGVDTGIADPEPSSSLHCASPHSPQVANEDETLQHVLDNAY